MDSEADKLELGFQRLANAGQDSDQLGQALLSLHGGLEDYFRDWLIRSKTVPYDVQVRAQDRRQVQWKELLDLMQQYGGVGSDYRTIQRMNAFRQDVAHGAAFRGTRQGMEAYATLVRRITHTSASPRASAARPPAIPAPPVSVAVRPVLSRAPVASPAPARRPALPTWLRTLWSGRFGPALRWRTLLGIVVAFLAVPVLYKLALSALRWTMPQALVGWVCLFLAVAALGWGVWLTAQALLQLGIKRMLLGLAILYAVAVVAAGLTLPTGQPGLAHWLASARNVLGLAGSGAGRLLSSLVQSPEAIRSAATRQRDAAPIPGVTGSGGVPTTPLAATLTPPADKGKPGSTPTLNPTSQTTRAPGDRPLRIGLRVRVAGTGGTSLRAREKPSTDANVMALFAEGTELEIIDGPQKSGGREWWRVRRGQSEGWCAGEYLAPVEGP